MKVYITSSSAITSQHTFNKEEYLQEWISHSPEASYLSALEPDYKNIIDPKLSRRMSRIIKMSVATGSRALSDVGIKQPGAIVVGTGLGCIKDTEKFLKDIIEGQEGLLSPTAFIQSTHNTVAGQLALMLQCSEDNFTYVNRGHSFENALIDAVLRIKEGTEHILLGGADEMIPEVYGILEKMNCQKDIAPGEGACFFVLSGSESEGAVCIEDVTTFNHIEPAQLKENLNSFLKKNALERNEIDALVLGLGKKTDDPYYNYVIEAFGPEVPVVDFKSITGEYFTASAYAYQLGSEMLRNQQIFRNTLFSGVNSAHPMRRLLIYNHCKEENHSISLLSI